MIQDELRGFTAPPLGITDPQNEFVWGLEKTKGPAMADDSFYMWVPPQLEKLTLAELSHKSLRRFTLSLGCSYK